MSIIIGLIGIAFSVVLVAKREAVGDMIGEAEWMQKAGGVYNVVIIIAFVCFLWSLAYMTGTLGFLFAPIVGLFGQKPM